MTAAAGGHARIPYLPALDGLRGLALVGVLLFHANGALKGGYLGVDLFFVLSGYLITALLVAEWRTRGSIDLRAFWIRRARRLLPAVLSLIPAIAAYVLWLAPAAEAANIRWDALATLSYVANWRTIFAAKSYWDLFAQPSPLEHTWSLAIEEQFYLLWPLIVVPVLRRGSTRGLLRLTIALAAASMAAMWWLYDPANSSRVYLGTDTRAAGILVGAAFALAWPPTTEVAPRTARRLDAVAGVAIVFLAAAWWGLEGSDPRLYRGGLWCTELAVLALIACAVAGKRSMVARLLSLRPLRWLGMLSYGAYLWHWPVNVVLSAERTALSPLPLNALRLAITFAIAAVSYRLLEQPIRKRGVPFGRPWLIVSGAFAVGVAMLGATAVLRPPPVPSVRAAILPLTLPDHMRVLMLGDSTANTLGWAIRGLRSPTVSTELRGENAFSLINDGPKWTSWSKHIRDIEPDVAIIMLSGAFLYGMTAAGEWRHACYPAWDEQLEKALDARLRDLPRGAVTVWFTTVPYPLGRYDNATFHGYVDCINRSLRRVLARYPAIHILDLAEMQCPNKKCRREHAGEAMRPDGVHYDLEGARPIAESTLFELRAVDRRRRSAPQ